MDILKLNEGESANWKFGLSTRYVERLSNSYLIHETSSGWYTAEVSLDDMPKLLKGEMLLMDLDWN